MKPGYILRILLPKYDDIELEDRKLLVMRNPLSTKKRFTAIVPAVVWP
jgi:hypothetical protein